MECGGQAPAATTTKTPRHPVRCRPSAASAPFEGPRKTGWDASSSPARMRPRWNSEPTRSRGRSASELMAAVTDALPYGFGSAALAELQRLVDDVLHVEGYAVALPHIGSSRTRDRAWSASRR